MRKLFLFVIATILIAPNAWAFSTEIGACVNPSWVQCTPSCCAPTSARCAEYCGATLPTACEGLSECEGITAWTNMTDGTNRQVVCKNPYSESAYCSYRCKENYYVAGYLPTIVGSEPMIFSCVACPANATCEDQTAYGPNCNSGYYRHAVLCEKPGSTGTTLGSYYTYECLPCPSGASCDGGGRETRV